MPFCYISVPIKPGLLIVYLVVDWSPQNDISRDTNCYFSSMNSALYQFDRNLNCCFRGYICTSMSFYRWSMPMDQLITDDKLWMNYGMILLTYTYFNSQYISMILTYL